MFSSLYRFKSQLCCALRCTSENPASWWPLLLMQCVCSVSRCCLAPQIIMLLFLWRLFQADCFLHVSPTTWWVIIWEYFMFLKLNSLLFRKPFTELLQFICCCCSGHVQVNQLCRAQAQLSPRSNPGPTWAAAQGARSCSVTDLQDTPDTICHFTDFLSSSMLIAPRYHWLDFQ